jgi:hypothetical protein
MNTWSPLWSGIVESSLWEESGDVVKVFMTLLARKDSDHVSRLTAFNIHKLCNIDEVEVLEILKLLASPDKRRLEQQEFDGRRIQVVEDGWLILNGEKYRRMVSNEMRKARLRRAQAKFRAKNAGKPFPAKSKEEEDAAHEAVRIATQRAHEADEEQRNAVQTLNEVQGQQPDNHLWPDVKFEIEPDHFGHVVDGNFE